MKGNEMGDNREAMSSPQSPTDSGYEMDQSRPDTHHTVRHSRPNDIEKHLREAPPQMNDEPEPVTADARILHL
jgi:hypothetical protein